jgi:hypothetical protein
VAKLTKLGQVYKRMPGKKVRQEIVMPISSLGDGIARENWPIESGET